MSLGWVKNVAAKGKYGLLAVPFFLTSGTTTYAADLAGSCSSKAGGQAWLTKLNTLLSDPVEWIMYIAAVSTALFLGIGFLKWRNAQGRPEKLEQANKFLTHFAVGSFGVFAVTGIATWFLGKLCT